MGRAAGRQISLVTLGTLVGVIAWLGWHLRRAQARLEEVTSAHASQTTALESAHLELQRLSTDDNLTALANHEPFLEFVEREWRRARREEQPVSLVVLDIDHVRSFNRQFGRRTGDECLRQIGKAVEGLAGRAGDLIARYHRDEFAVVLSGTETIGALRVANRIREAVEGLQLPAARDAELPMVTVSAAVACAIPERHSRHGKSSTSSRRRGTRSETPAPLVAIVS
jgi:diguanylate cyclase (GGDEF)-like protein